MTGSALTVEPPHLIAALYVDRLEPRAAFAAVCEAMVEAGAHPTGAFQFLEEREFPQFAMLSDLARRLKSEDLRWQKRPDPSTWRGWVAGDGRELQVVRAGFDMPGIGRAVVAFGPTGDGLEVDRHPLTVTVGGALLSMPSGVALDRRERAQAAATARFLARLFRSICEGLDPLYAHIAVEADLPTPALLARQEARVGTELFTSRRLAAADRRLDDELDAIFAGGAAVSWGTGRFHSGWAPFNTERRSVTTPLDVTRRAASRLARSLQVLGSKNNGGPFGKKD